MITYCKVLLPYFTMSQSVRDQFGIVDEPPKTFSVEKLLEEEINLLGAKHSSIYPNFSVLVSDKYGSVKRIVKDGWIELIGEGISSKRPFSCPLP